MNNVFKKTFYLINLMVLFHPSLAFQLQHGSGGQLVLDVVGGQLVLSYLFAVHKVCEANKDKPCFPRKIPTITQE